MIQTTSECSHIMMIDWENVIVSKSEIIILICACMGVSSMSVFFFFFLFVFSHDFVKIYLDILFVCCSRSLSRLIDLL